MRKQEKETERAMSLVPAAEEGGFFFYLLAYDIEQRCCAGNLRVQLLPVVL